MNQKRKYYITGSIVLLVMSLGSIIGALIFSRQPMMHGRGVLGLLIGLCSLVAISTFLTMMVTRNYTKSFSEAFKGTEKKCLVGALTVMTAIVMTMGCLSFTRMTGRYDRQTMNSQEMFGQRGNRDNRHQRFGRGNFPNDGNQSQQTPDENNQSQNQTPPQDQKTEQSQNSSKQASESTQNETSSAQ